MTIGEKIRYCREKRGLTQQELAELSGIHAVSIRKYETNRMKPQSKQLRRIAEALGISYAALSGTHTFGFQLNTVGDLHSILLALIDAHFFLYQDGKLRFNPLLDKYLVCKDKKSHPHSINNITIESASPVLLLREPSLSYEHNSDENEKLMLDVQILNDALEAEKMSIGKRIRHFRLLRGMTQKELGIALNLDGDVANRITQYEQDYRKPGHNMLTKIAEVLKVSPAALTVHYHTDPVDIMHVLFLAEELCGLQIELTDKKLSLHFNSSAIPPVFKGYLMQWLETEKAYQQGQLTKADYEQWKYSFSGKIPE